MNRSSERRSRTLFEFSNGWTWMISERIERERERFVFIIIFFLQNPRFDICHWSPKAHFFLAAAAGPISSFASSLIYKFYLVILSMKIGRFSYWSLAYCGPQKESSALVLGASVKVRLNPHLELIFYALLGVPCEVTKRTDERTNANANIFSKRTANGERYHKIKSNANANGTFWRTLPSLKNMQWKCKCHL